MQREYVMSRITVQQIQAATAREHGITQTQLLMRTRRRRYCWPRQEAMYLARKLTHCSLPDLAVRFGGYDHTTVMYAVRCVEDRLAAGHVKTQESIGRLLATLTQPPIEMETPRAELS